MYLRYAGRCDESIAVHLSAESLDPFSIVAIMEVGFAFYYARRFAEAGEQIQKAIALEPAWDQLYFWPRASAAAAETIRRSDRGTANRGAKRARNVFSMTALIYGLDARRQLIALR